MALHTSTPVVQDPRLVELGINVIRGLAMDAPAGAHSGHSGTAMALAPLAHVLWTRIMHYDPRDPQWPDRDRFVLSNGHACILQYAMLHLTGYDLTLEDLRQFRQWGSRTPGHPEAGHTAGHRGHDRARSARASPTRWAWRIAERWLRTTLRHRGLRPPHLRDRRRRLLHGGDLPRGGVAGRAPRPGPAARLLRRQPHHDRRADRAGLQRRRAPSASRPTAGRCATSARWPTTSTGWRPPSARRSTSPADGPDAKPTLLVLRSHIGWPSPHLTDTADGPRRSRSARRRSGPPRSSSACRRTRRSGCPTRCATSTASRSPRGARASTPSGPSASPPGRATAPAWDAAQAGHGLPGLGRRPARASRPATQLATRHAINQCIDATAARLPGLAGRLGRPDRQQRREGQGRRAAVAPRRPAAIQVHYGIREHGMGAVMNGMAAHGGVLPVGGTFFVFSDYMRPRGPPGRADRAPRHLLVDPRLDRPGPGRPDAPAGRAAGVAAGHAGPRASSGRPTPTRRRRPGGSPSRRTGRSAWCSPARTSPCWPRPPDGRAEGVGARRLRPASTATATAADRPGRHRQRGAALPGRGRPRWPTSGVRAQVVSFPCWDRFERRTEDYRAERASRRACPCSASRPARPSAGSATPTTPSGSTTSARRRPGAGRHGEVRLHGRPRGRAGTGAPGPALSRLTVADHGTSRRRGASR